MRYCSSADIDIGSPGQPIDVDALEGYLTCMRRDIQALVYAPVILAEATPLAGLIYQSPGGNLLSVSDSPDSSGVNTFYLSNTIGGSGIELVNGSGESAEMGISAGTGPGKGDNTFTVSTTDGDIVLFPQASGVPPAGHPYVDTLGRFRCGDATNGKTIWELDGFMSMSIDARPTLRTSIGVGEMQLDGSAPPAAGGFDAAPYLGFDPTTDELIRCSIAVPGGWDSSESPQIFLHWTPSSTDANTVTWCVNYAVPADGEAATGSDALLVITDDSGGTSGAMQTTAVATLSKGNVDDGPIVYLRLFRDANASETAADDDYPDDARLLSIEILWVADQLGLDQW